MKESTVLFGDTRSVVGIISEPEQGASTTGLGCLILNAGSIHRVGPQRLYVKLARRLAAAGITSLRFDYSGVGDSPLRSDNLPFAESAEQEAQRAMDVLEARGVSRFLAVGICWGADNALRIAKEDPRIVGAGLVDFYFVNSTRYLLRLYRGRVLSWRSWKNLFGGGSSVLRMGLGLLAGALRMLLPGSKAGSDDSVMPIDPPAEVAAQVRDLVARGANMCFVFTTGSASWDHYSKHFQAAFGELADTGRLCVRTMPDADHLFTLLRNQSELIDQLVEWACDVGNGVVSTPLASTSPRVEARAE